MTQTWLITGSSRGLGRALAEAVLAAGHNVVATARDPEQVHDLVDRFPGHARAVALDVTDRAAAAAAVAATVDASAASTCSSTTPATPTSTRSRTSPRTTSAPSWRPTCGASINVTRAALPVLREQGAGHIIQVSSVGGRVTTPGIGPYQTAKWAVEGFSGVLAKEVEPLGIKVTIIEPGGFRTDWAGSSMTVHGIRDAYEPTVGVMNRYREGAVANGDPARPRRRSCRSPPCPSPPLRLLLGSDAFKIARAADEAKIAEDEAWRELTLSTDFAAAVMRP